MSNPTTNFLTGGVDLSSIFMPLSQGSAYSSNTGYTVNNNDLNTIFAANMLVEQRLIQQDIQLIILI
jgi:hypothetical protein